MRLDKEQQSKKSLSRVWTEGSFFLLSAVVLLAASSLIIPPENTLGRITAGVIFFSMVSLAVLRSTNRLREENFVRLFIPLLQIVGSVNRLVKSTDNTLEESTVTNSDDNKEKQGIE